MNTVGIDVGKRKCRAAIKDRSMLQMNLNESNLQIKVINLSYPSVVLLLLLSLAVVVFTRFAFAFGIYINYRCDGCCEGSNINTTTSMGTVMSVISVISSFLS